MASVRLPSHSRLKSTHFIHPTTPLHGHSTVSQQVNLKLTDLCFKVFVIVAIVLAAIIVIVGVLALMAAKGAIPGAPNPLNKIGEFNSFVMIGGGAFLFVLGILAWSCQLYKESQQQNISKAHVVRALFND